jgi:sugar phosphate isomerase/epimerase
MNCTRSEFLRHAAGAVGLAGLSSLAAQAAGSEQYQLGCQTLPYRSLPLSRALQGIRKAGYKYVMIFHEHARQPAFSPSLSREGRAELKRRLKDEGLTPFMSFVGLTGEVRKPEGLKKYIEELDLCAEFGVRTVVGTGPWYYTKFPNLPKRARDWEAECNEYYASMERAVRHAESIGVTITLKPHTGITANARTCMDVVKRIVSDRFKICWDAGNVSFYEGIYPDPDLPDLAPHVKSVCIKDHMGGRAAANFPVPGQGQIDHDQMFRILFAAGFNGPVALERADGTDNAAKMPPELIDERITQAYNYLAPLLEKLSKTARS